MVIGRATLFWALVARVGLAGATPVGSRGTPLPLVTPTGITVQSRNGTDLVLGNYQQRRVELQYYADGAGMALYTYAKDGPNESVCYADCALAWPPLIAAQGAKAFDAWSLVTRNDGRK